MEEEINPILYEIKNDTCSKMKEAAKKGNWQRVEYIKDLFPNEEIIAFYTKLCIIYGKFEEARNVGKQYPDSERIQAKIVMLDQIEEKNSEAKAIGKRFPKSELIQARMINIAIKEGDLGKARTIAEKPLFKDSPTVQAQAIKLYALGHNDAKIDEIVKRFPEEKKIILEQIQVEIQQGEYDLAREICDKYKDDVFFQSQLINVESRTKNYEKAKKMGAKFPDKLDVQSQMIKIAIKENDYEMAKKIGEKFPDYYVIQSQMVRVAMHEKDYETAKKIGKRFSTIGTIQSQMLKIAIDKKEYTAIHEIESKFPESPIIQLQMLNYYLNNGQKGQADKIGMRFRHNYQIRERLEQANSNDNEKLKKRFLDKIKTYIYEGEIDEKLLEEVQNSGFINEWEKTLIKLAILEKSEQNVRMNAMILEYKEKYSNIPQDRKRILSSLSQRTAGKSKKVFGWAVYDDELRWEINESLAKNIEETRKSKEQAKSDFMQSIKFQPEQKKDQLINANKKTESEPEK